MRKFFVLTTTRSGSTWFQSLLRGQPGVAAYGELFMRKEGRAETEWVREGSPERFVARRAALPGPRPRRVWRYLREVERHRPEAAATGFKLILSQLRFAPELLPALALRDYRLVLLLRDNHFESVVSSMALEATDVAHSRTEDAGDLRFAVDPAELVRRIAARRRGFRMMRAIQRFWPAPSVEVRYDPIARNPMEGLATVLGVIGLDQPPAPVESPLKKRIRAPYSEVITNFDEVSTALSAAGYGALAPGRG